MSRLAAFVQSTRGGFVQSRLGARGRGGLPNGICVTNQPVIVWPGTDGSIRNVFRSAPAALIFSAQAGTSEAALFGVSQGNDVIYVAGRSANNPDPADHLNLWTYGLDGTLIAETSIYGNSASEPRGALFMARRFGSQVFCSGQGYPRNFYPNTEGIWILDAATLAIETGFRLDTAGPTNWFYIYSLPAGSEQAYVSRVVAGVFGQKIPATISKVTYTASTRGSQLSPDWTRTFSNGITEALVDDDRNLFVSLAGNVGGWSVAKVTPANSLHATYDSGGAVRGLAWSAGGELYASTTTTLVTLDPDDLSVLATQAVTPTLNSSVANAMAYDTDAGRVVLGSTQDTLASYALSGSRRGEALFEDAEFIVVAGT